MNAGPQMLTNSAELCWQLVYHGGVPIGGIVFEYRKQFLLKFPNNQNIIIPSFTWSLHSWNNEHILKQCPKYSVLTGTAKLIWGFISRKRFVTYLHSWLEICVGLSYTWQVVFPPSPGPLKTLHMCPNSILGWSHPCTEINSVEFTEETKYNLRESHLYVLIYSFNKHFQNTSFK